MARLLRAGTRKVAGTRAGSAERYSFQGPCSEPRTMTDRLSPQGRSEIMAAVRHFDTAPELAVRSHLHRAGLRFRVHSRSLPGRPDIVLRRYGVVVRVHGCFWHGHAGCRRGRLPESNRAYWSRKIERNRRRDARSARQLRRMGWRVLTVWTCRITPGNLGRIIRSIRNGTRQVQH